MTGGGFGGSVVALVERGRAEETAGAVLDAYRARTGASAARWFVTAAADGAREL